MGGKSTLQSAVLGSKRGNTPRVDLHSWQGLTEVLRRGKESLKDPAAYAEFRNLVLEYAQQGGDPELRKQIDKIVATFENASQPTKAPSTSEESTNTRKRRRKRKKKESQTPTGSSEDSSSITPEQERSPSASMRRVPPTFRTPVAPEPTQPRPAAEPPVGLPVETKEPNAIGEPKAPPIEPETPTPQQPKEPAPEKIETSPKPKAQEEKKVEPATPTPATEPPTTATVKSAEEYKTRIAEIKRLVHEQIGNPATLVDAYAERGKEYMMALLAALKATGPGSPESPVAAMARLERAYEALLTTPPVEEKEEVQPEKREEEKAEPTPVEAVTPAPASKPVPESTPHEEEKVIQEPITSPDIEEKKAEPPVTELVAQNAPEPKDDKVENETPRPLDLPDIKTPPTRKEQGEVDADEHEEEKSIEERRSTLSPASTLASLLMKNDDDDEEPKDTARALHEIPPERVASSVHQEVEKVKAEAPEIPKPADTGYKPLNGVDPAQAVVRQSELSSPEVTQALHQLLNEWSLFKSSGLFGIGPSGAEHPLYQKLAPLSMAEVVSGRWEGSDRKITANIKEYVNAWRHEQGVAYNIQETFEHFLRRVVLRIQKRQANQ